MQYHKARHLPFPAYELHIDGEEERRGTERDGEERSGKKTEEWN
jgi:hypothetical protein